MLIVRFILGVAATVAVWLATWSFESGDLDELILATLFSVTLSAFGSWLSLRLNLRKKAAPFVFAAPFAILALICVPSLFGESQRPFMFWTICTAAALLLALFSEAIVFRKIVDEEESS